MKRVVSFRWFKGFLVVSMSRDGLSIMGSNSRIVLGDRQISVRGLYQGMREYDENPRAQVKTLYIDLAFPIKGVDKPGGEVYLRTVDTYIDNYGLSYTPLDELGYFLTIYPPSGALYENVIIGPDMIVVTMLRRRHIYLMDEGEEKIIILV